MDKHFVVGALAGLAVVAGAANAQILPEIEPNETKAEALANGPFIFGDGGGVTGSTTGTSTTTPGLGSADTFLIQNIARPLGIYRHRLVLDNSAYGATIRGLNQVAAPAGPWAGVVGTPGTADNTAQSSVFPTGAMEFNQWYGFGRQEQFYYRVTGTANTTATYTATMETVPVTPMSLGSFQPGNITISTLGQGHSSDTDFWVYDGNLNAIVGSGVDDESVNSGPGTGTGSTLQGVLNRTYAPGTYYIAMTNFNIANDQPSPSDDDFRTGTIMDFANIVLNSSTSTNLNMTFALTDSGGIPQQFAATKAGQFDIVWATFEVVPAPSSLALLGLGGLVAARRRRA